MLERLEPPMIDHFSAEWVARDRYDLRPDARRFENWENNYAARLGLGARQPSPALEGHSSVEAVALSFRRAALPFFLRR